MHDAYSRTLNRRAEIEQLGFNVVEKWGCDLDKQLADNDQMKEFFKQTKIMQALDARNGELNLS
jgi:G:T-mismatch repair DNA endonuclease (very short patch repair protein)